MEHKLEEIISEAVIKGKVSELAIGINSDYEGKQLLVVGVLRGSAIFFADLVRELKVDIELEFVSVSSYSGNMETNSDPKLKWDIDFIVNNKNILIVEDIVDSGFTMSFLQKLFKDLGASSVKVITLLNKPSRRRVYVELDYIGFTVDDRFFVGYGLDYADKYRNLSGIYELTLS